MVQIPYSVVRGGVLVAMAVVGVVGCGRTQGLLSPTVAGGGSGLSTAGVSGQKTALCHATGNGHFTSIDVSVAAEATHREHGDAASGEPVPGQPGMVFDSDCVPVPALTCGAPPNATNPGSTTPPGHALDTRSSNQFVQYQVTNVLAPAGTMIDLAVYLDGVLFVTLARQPLVNGVYTQLFHQINQGTASMIYEVRASLGSSQCSLFWNINP